jgi:uncharacterized protein (AIM24 family)
MNEELNFKILGDSAQVLEITLSPNTTLIGDGGALLYLDHEIGFETRDTDGSEDLKGESTESEDDFEEEEPEPEPVVDDFEDFEERDQKGNLLQKLWIATKRKVMDRVIKKPEKEEPEPEPEKEEPLDELDPELEDEKETILSWYITHFTNFSEFVRKVAFTTANSGIVLNIDLRETTDNELIIQTGTFLCAKKGVKIEKFLDTKLGVNFTKENLFKLDKIKGEELVFLQCEGQTLAMELDNDAIRIGLFSLIAFESTLELDLESVVNVQSMNYEDNTQFITLSGTGRYWIQTANVQQLMHRIAPFMFEPEEEGLELNKPITPQSSSALDDRQESDLGEFLRQASEEEDDNN